MLVLYTCSIPVPARTFVPIAIFWRWAICFIWSRSLLIYACNFDPIYSCCQWIFWILIIVLLVVSRQRHCTSACSFTKALFSMSMGIGHCTHAWFAVRAYGKASNILQTVALAGQNTSYCWIVLDVHSFFKWSITFEVTSVDVPTPGMFSCSVIEPSISIVLLPFPRSP